MSSARPLLVYVLWVAAGVVGGYLGGVVVSFLGAVTNVGLIVGVLLPEAIYLSVLFWLGNGVFLAVFGYCVAAGFSRVQPRASHTSSVIAGSAAVVLAFVLIAAPSLLLLPALVLIDQISPSAARVAGDGAIGSGLFVLAAYGVFGGGGGLIAGLAHAGTRAPAVVILGNAARKGMRMNSGQLGGSPTRSAPIRGVTGPTAADSNETEAQPLAMVPKSAVPGWTVPERMLANLGFPQVARFVHLVAALDPAALNLVERRTVVDYEFRVAARTAMATAALASSAVDLNELISQSVSQRPVLAGLSTQARSVVLVAGVALAAKSKLSVEMWRALWSPFAEIILFSSVWTPNPSEPPEFQSPLAMAALADMRADTQRAMADLLTSDSNND